MLIFLFFITTEVHAQYYDAVLILDSIPSQVKEGDIITFSGQLLTSDGQYVISNKEVYIKDDVDFGSDTILGVVTTDQNGRFAATWPAQQRSSGMWDFYAIFEGDNQISKARSNTYSVNVISSYSGSSSGSGSYSGGSGSNSGGTTYYRTEIMLDPLPSQIYVNDVVTFTGRLTTNGSPVEGALVYIKEDDPFSPDEYLGNGRTNSRGEFSIQWKVKAGYVEKDFDIYAIFEGVDNFQKSRSENRIMSVLKYTGGITLDSFPSRANIGDIVTFSGTLDLGAYSSEGAIVYIKDEDPLSGDDLLVTAYVDRNGRFSANWFVTDVDADGIADVYAAFEGNDDYYRLTTCDYGPTPVYGGGCMNTIPLTIRYSQILPPPIPNPDTTNKEYMELFYALDFTKNPKVAIVPDPDSYDESTKSIVPVQEGILMWKSYLDSSYGGNWNVDFDVVSANDLFFTSRPDIIVNLITPERDSRCNTDYYGYAKIYQNPVKPIQTYVCVSANGKSYTSDVITATAAHEFIHAMGLAHAWNKPGDLMCSTEEMNGQMIYTCPTNYPKSKTPSDLNLAGVTKIYGNDGYKNPNNKISFKTKYSPSQSVPDIELEKVLKVAKDKSPKKEIKKIETKSKDKTPKTKFNDTKINSKKTIVNISKKASTNINCLSQCFVSSNVKISVGGTITWTNMDSEPHTVISGNPEDGPNGKFESKLIKPGKAFSNKFTKKGNFDYFCLIHPWMQGMVTVK